MLDRILIESVKTQLESNLDSGEYQCHNDGGRPYLTNSRGLVLCIYNGEFSYSQSQSFIDKARDFYDLLPPDIKALAQRKITASNPQTAGASLQTRGSVETNPDATRLTETQCQILKAIFGLQTGVYFNKDCKAITSVDERHCYRPDNLNGGWTTSRISRRWQTLRPLSNSTRNGPSARMRTMQARCNHHRSAQQPA